MAAQVEVQTGEVGRTGVGGRLHLSPLSDSSNKSLIEGPSSTQGSLIITPEPTKPVLGPKPRLTPKPFTVERNPTVRPILAPKPHTKPRPEPTRPTAYKPDPPSTPKPQQSNVTQAKPRSVSTNPNRPSPTSFKPSPKLNTGQTTKPVVQPFKPAPPLSHGDPSKPTPPKPAERQKPGAAGVSHLRSPKKPPAAEWSGTTKKEDEKDKMASSNGSGGTSMTRAKSMGFLSQIGQEEKETKHGVTVALRPQPRGSRPRPVSAIFLPSPTKPESPTPSPRWTVRRPLSADLTSKFESVGLSLYRKPASASSKENTPEERAPPPRRSETENGSEGTATTPQGAEAVAKPAVSGQGNEVTTSENEKVRVEEKGGGSIKRRISLLLDSSSSPGPGASGQGSELHSPAQPIPEADAPLGVRQRIKQLTEDVPPVPSPPLKPTPKPRPLPLDLTKRFTTERSTELGSPSFAEATDPHESDRTAPRRVEESTDIDDEEKRAEDSKVHLTHTSTDPMARRSEDGQMADSTSKDSGPSSEVQTVRASLFENVVERHSVLVLEEDQPKDKGKTPLGSPFLKGGDGEDEGTLVTATYREPMSPSSPLRVLHSFDTVQAVEESRALSEMVSSAQLEDKAMTLRSRRSEGSRPDRAEPLLERPAPVQGEPAMAPKPEHQPRYLRVGALQKWNATDPVNEAGTEKGPQREVERERQMALEKERERQREAEGEETAAAPKRLKMLEADEQPKPRATYFALTGQIQEPVSPGDTGAGRGDMVGPFDDFSVRSGQRGSQGKILPARRNPLLDEAFGKSPNQGEEQMERSQTSERERGSARGRQAKEEEMEVEKQREMKRESERQQGRMKELEREKQRQLELERQQHLEFARMKERERQREFERQRQKEFERERQQELERQKHIELERQKQIELERQKHIELERQKQIELERQKHIELERQKLIELEREKQRQLERERQRELERERQRQLERERQQELERERQEELDRERQQELERERQRQLERERQQELERERQRELEGERQRELERERQRQLERERQRELERERQRELERERQRELERERQRELERERQRELERERQRELERERQRELERERKNEIERERLRELEKERQRLREQERQRELDRERELLEIQRERQRQEELEKIKELERRQLLEFELQKQAERERQQLMELEKRRLRERMEREEAEKARQAAIQQEADRQRELERQREVEKERCVELERERQRELQRQRDLERERQKQLDAERLEMEKQRSRQRELEKDRQRKEEAERLKEMERRQFLEFERQRQQERERERQQLVELEKRRLREEAERSRQIAEQQEAERQRLKEKQRREEQEWAAPDPDPYPLRPKVLDLDSVLRDDQFPRGSPHHGDPATWWKQPSPRADEPYKPAILDIDSFTSQTQPSPNKEAFPVAGIQAADAGSGARSRPLTPERDASRRVPQEVSLGRPSPVWAPSPQDPWELRPGEMSVDSPVAGPEPPSKPAGNLIVEQLLLRQEERHTAPSLVPERHWSIVSHEPSPFSRREANTAGSPGRVSGSTSMEQLWYPREPEPQGHRGEVRGYRRSQGSQELNRMRSRSVSRRSAPLESTVEGSLSRMRSRSAHRERDRRSWVQPKQSVGSDEEVKDTDTLVHDTDSQYGTWETGLRTDDSLTPATPTSDSNLSPSPRKPTPPLTPGEHASSINLDTPDGLSPTSPLESQLAAFPEAPTALLDTSAMRSRAQLGKKRGPRSRPSRAARQSTALTVLPEGGATEDWRYRDSTEDKPESKQDSDSEEPARGADSRSAAAAAASQPQRIPLFPGMDPSALKAQLKKRGDADNQIDGPAPSPSQLSRSPKSPFLPRAARVLPPAGGKENGGEDSPQWLRELKSKKRLSQYENDG
ncbi:uncharacterized protein ACJ7VT_009374 isoform 1-T2 [Polymixia lowei]